MERLTPIIRFYARARHDTRLTPTHQSLYLALFYLWQQSGCGETFTISRRALMPLARLQSIATYHKCIRELKAWGYIEYHPSYNYYKGSKVKLLSDSEPVSPTEEPIGSQPAEA